MQLMRNRCVGCLPVVEGDQLVGIVTSYDFLEASARLFEQHLKEPMEDTGSRARAQSA
jgi:CBS domain-containing protein